MTIPIISSLVTILPGETLCNILTPYFHQLSDINNNIAFQLL